MTDEQKKLKGTVLVGSSGAPLVEKPAPDKLKGTMLAGTPAFPQGLPDAPGPTAPASPAEAPRFGTVRMSAENVAEAVAKIEATEQAAAAQRATAEALPPTTKPAPVPTSRVISLGPDSPQASAPAAQPALSPSKATGAAGAVSPWDSKPGASPPGGGAPPPGPSAPPPVAVPGPPVASVPPFAAAVAPAAQVAASAPPPAAAQSVAPKAQGSALRYLVIVGVLAIVGLVLVVGVGGFGYYFYATGPGASKAPKATTASEQGRAEGEEGAATAPNEALAQKAAPEAAASASEAGGVTEAAGADEPTVLLKCTPACDGLDSIVCDKQESKLTSGGLILPPGEHECVFGKAGYAARQVKVVVKQGERNEATIVLAPLQRRPPGAKQEPCGTFINPCK